MGRALPVFRPRFKSTTEARGQHIIVNLARHAGDGLVLRVDISIPFECVKRKQGGSKVKIYHEIILRVFLTTNTGMD
jgi:hypothetical protein